jgi:hypothetical protein
VFENQPLNPKEVQGWIKSIEAFERLHSEVEVPNYLSLIALSKVCASSPLYSSPL